MKMLMPLKEGQYLRESRLSAEVRAGRILHLGRKMADGTLILFAWSDVSLRSDGAIGVAEGI